MGRTSAKYKQTATIIFHTDTDTKAQCNEIFHELGLDMTNALNMFLKQVALKKAIPFSVDSVTYSDEENTDKK
jgi:DNA-damage-inducible protein J